jgi:predicted nucleotidyltransferase
MDRIVDINPIIAGFSRALSGLGVRGGKIYLFGSWSRGEQTAESDIDIAVVSSDFAPMNYWTRIEALAGAVAAIRAPIEAVAFTPDEFREGRSPIISYAKNGIEMDWALGT